MSFRVDAARALQRLREQADSERARFPGAKTVPQRKPPLVATSVSPRDETLPPRADTGIGPPPTLTAAIRVRVSEAERDMLRRLAAHYRTNESEIVVEALRGMARDAGLPLPPTRLESRIAARERRRRALA